MDRLSGLPIMQTQADVQLLSFFSCIRLLAGAVAAHTHTT